MRILRGEELKEYPKFFEKIFGFPPDKQIPKTVIVDERSGERRGFIRKPYIHFLPSHKQQA